MPWIHPVYPACHCSHCLWVTNPLRSEHDAFVHGFYYTTLQNIRSEDV